MRGPDQGRSVASSLSTLEEEKGILFELQKIKKGCDELIRMRDSEAGRWECDREVSSSAQGA